MRDFLDEVMTSHLSTGVLIYLADGACLYANDAAARILAVSREDLLSENIRASKPHQGANALLLGLQILDSGDSQEYEISIEHEDGAVRHVLARFNSASSSDGDQVLLVTLEDISEVRRVSQALHANEEYFEAMIDNLSDVITVVDQTGEIVFRSPSVERVLGLTPQELGSRRLSTHDLVHPDDMPRVLDCFAQIMSKPGLTVPPIEVRMKHTDGSYRTLETSAKSVMGPEGKMLAVVNSRDVTDRNKAERELANALEQLEESQSAILRMLATVTELRDPYTAGHQHRVAEICIAIGQALELSQDQMKGVEIAALLHDVGKISVPTEILVFPGPLAHPQRELIRGHVMAGYTLIKTIPLAWPVADIVMQHHERLDGSGYPCGLRDDSIMLEARILAVADTVEAMSSHRPYRAALPAEEVERTLREGRGVTFDARVVDAALELMGGGPKAMKDALDRLGSRVASSDIFALRDTVLN